MVRYVSVTNVCAGNTIWSRDDMVKLDRVMNYPNALKLALTAAIDLGMSPADIIRYLIAYTKNARTQLGSPEQFSKNINSFKTRMQSVYFRDNRVDPGTLVELVANQYEFSKMGHNGSFVDVGAAIGIASKLFSFYNPNTKIFCFEPVIESADIIKFNCPAAKIYNCAIGQRVGKHTFYIHPKNFMAFKDVTPTHLKRTVTVFPLDFFVSEIGEVGMLKIDTEGSEVDILLGAHKTLKQTKEVRMETHSHYLHEESKKILARYHFKITKEYIGPGGIGYIFAKIE